MSKVVANELRGMLKNGTVSFTYKKLNGEIREANGTTNLGFVPEENHPKGTGTPKEGVINYYDLDKDAWRSFHEDNIVGIKGYIQKSHREVSTATGIGSTFI